MEVGHSDLLRQRAEAIFAELVTYEQWMVFEPLLTEAKERGLGFALGGGVAYSIYTGHCRNTKDMDFFLLPGDSEAFLELMARHGFTEYTEFPYDRAWSYRGRKGDYILDVLWGLLNEGRALDGLWISRGMELNCRGTALKLIPVEELIWSKLYIVYRDRCDWPDLLLLLYARGRQLDWKHLLGRLGENAPMLGGVLALFRWMCPGRAADLPAWVWPAVGLKPGFGPKAPEVDLRRAELLRGGDWFSGNEGDTL
jgi:hypothetical protein